MSQGRVRGRGRGYRGFRIDTNTPRPTDQLDNVTKTTRNISHNNNCCQEITTNFELDPEGVMFFQELKRLWNMCKYFCISCRIFLNYVHCKANFIYSCLYIFLNNLQLILLILCC